MLPYSKHLWSCILGVVYGVGLACATTFPPNIVKKHFKKKFNTANGISIAGPSLGALFIPPTATFLINIYGISGAFLILSGIMLNALPIGIYIQSVGVVQNNLIKHQKREDRRVRIKHKKESVNEDKIGIFKYETVDKIELSLRFASSNIETNPPSNTNDEGNVTLQLQRNEDQMYPNPSTNALDEEGNAKNTASISSSLQLQRNEYEMYSNNPSINSRDEEGDVKNPTSRSSSLQLQRNTEDKRKNILFGFGVFKDISFIFIMLTLGLGTYVTTLYWTTMIDYSRDKGISKNLEIYFLMLQPIFDLIGRTCFGWVIDFEYLTLSNFVILCNGQMAISLFFIMWAKHFWMMMAGACCYALASGAALTAGAGMIFKCVDKSHQTMAISSRHLLYGALIFTSSPLIGYFRENLGSYDGLYCLFIALLIVCAALTPLIFKFTKQNRTTMSNES